jgi:DinB superfamily
MTSQQLSVKVAINSWKLVAERAGKTFSNFTEDELLKEVAPGKNRVIYVWGHLTAIHDAMLSILGLGPRLHPELDAIFVSNPDETAIQLPSGGELKKYWDEVNTKLLSEFARLSADEWLERHHAMSEEDYAKDPTRNRLAVLLSRTNHMSYHLGQVILARA